MNIPGFSPTITVENVTSAIRAGLPESNFKPLVFAALANSQPKDLAQDLDAKWLAKFESYAQERAERIARAVVLINDFRVQRDEVSATVPAFTAAKEATKKLKKAFLQLVDLNAPCIVEVANDPLLADLMAHAKKSGSDENPAANSNLEEELPPNKEAVISEAMLSLSINTQAWAEAKLECQQIADYNFYAARKNAVQKSLKELSTFCLLAELTSHPNITDASKIWLNKKFKVIG